MMTNYNLDELILEQTSDAVIYANILGEIHRWNEAACQLFGFSKEEALGQNLNIIIPERARKAHWNGFDIATKSGNLRLSGKPTRTRALHKDANKKLYVEMSFSLITDTDHNVIGSVAIARGEVDPEK
ncbi:PAS domain S-box protein [Acinetobacter sp. YIM 103518]|uniref:PAS domain S-box protein n=2 Tax=Acinetobacter faecalis TaxID=2665161 RepID=A0A6L6GBD0_9GAMM|nr:PAS domain S-box protein [Acinetobacter faecalis]